MRDVQRLSDIMSDFVDNAERSRFELAEGGAIVFANYRRNGDVVAIPHVEAAPSLRGTGAAARLMARVAEHLRANGLKARPICSYAVAWFRRHPGYQDILER
jgi:predicted GNAT family acetyltransferase